MSGREVAAFAAGAALTLLAARLMPPLAGRAIGSLRSAFGVDPFAQLSADHRRVLAHLDSMHALPDGATLRRTAMLFQLKRMLSAHAMAEEDVVYPLLRDEAHAEDVAHGLYREHAEMKVRLYELERLPKDDPRWVANLGALRALIEAHARHEEETEFPRLRAALDEAARARLSSDMQREKSLLL
jgi:iron-sulfur cluster repair protein YtfE (RIC family)